MATKKRTRDLGAEVKARLLTALRERDEALSALADARAELDAMRVQRFGDESLPIYPSGAGPGEPPLRYLLADKANDVVKRVLKPVHSGVKKLVRRGRSAAR